MPGLQQQIAPGSGSSRLFSDGSSGGGAIDPNGMAVGGARGGVSPGLAGGGRAPYDGHGIDDGMPGLSPSPGSRRGSSASMTFGAGGGQRMDRRGGGGYGDQTTLMRAGSGPPLDSAQRAALGGGVVKGEMSRAAGAGQEESLRKRPRESWR